MKSVIKFLVLLIAPLALAAVSPASARPSLDAYVAAADRFDALAAATGGRAPPRRTDPIVAAVLDRLADIPSTLGGDAFGVADLDDLMMVNQRAYGVLTYYMNFGLDPAADSAVVQRVRGVNAARYQDEVLPVLVFTVELTGTYLPVVDAMLADSPSLTAEQRAGVGQIRRGLQMVIHGAILLSVDRALTPEHRLMMAASVARGAARLVPSLGLTQREPLRVLATEARALAGPQARSELDALVAALASRECNRICGG